MKTVHFPITVVDDFFEYPDEVREFALQQEYFSDPDNNWPGKRSKPLHEINYNLYNSCVSKFVSLFYDLNLVSGEWNGHASFQIVDAQYENGWVHADENLITAIVYLSKNVCGSGTTIYRPIDPTIAGIKNIDKKQESFNDTSLVKANREFQLKNNQQFRPTVTVESEYNRLFLFDSHLYHAANNFYGSNLESNRLTLIFFIYKLTFNNQKLKTIFLPVSRLRTTHG